MGTRSKGLLSYALKKSLRKKTLMTRYIGIDVHAQSCTFSVLGNTGRKLKHDCVQTDAKAIKQLMLSIPRPRHVCFEEGTLSEWLYELLEPITQLAAWFP